MQLRTSFALFGIATVLSAFVVTDKDTASAQSSIGRGVRQCLAQHSPVRFLDSSRAERMRQRRLLRACIRSVIFGNGGNGSSSSRSSVSSVSSSTSSLSTSSRSSSVSSQSSNSNSSVSSSSSSLSSVSSSLGSSSVSSTPSSVSSSSLSSSVGSSLSSSVSSISSASSLSASSVSSAAVVGQLTASVNIDNMAFTPGTITVKRGTRITWTNNDDTAHTVTRDGSQGPYSSVLSEGETYSRTFGTVGTYNYHCAIHPEMKGTIVVTE